MQLPGLFVTLEGIDGCGKSTQARLLADYLTDAGYEVVLTREPGGTRLAEEIRKIILTPSAELLDPTAEILLYAASRAQHVNNLIRPALAQGKMVICERFIDSSLAYQGYGLGLNLETITAINRMAIGDFAPALTFWLDMDTEVCRARISQRSANTQAGFDRIESRGSSFHEKVRQGFGDLAAQNPRIIRIDVSRKDIPEIHQLIVAAFLERSKVKN